MILRFFRSFLFHIYFIIITTYLGAVSAVRVLYNPAYAHIFYKRWGYFTAWGLKKICNITLEVRGAEHIPHIGQNALFAAKHQSALETILLFIVLDKPAVILKKELEKIPFAKGFIKGAGHIAIDRKAGSKTRQMMIDKAQETFTRKQSLLIFPEGTRSDVNAPPKYKRGIFALYDHLKTSCTPIALNSGLFWPKSGFLFSSGTVIFEFLPPIQAGYHDTEFMTELTTRIESATARLVQEAAAEQTAIRRKNHPRFD